MKIFGEPWYEWVAVVVTAVIFSLMFVYGWSL